MNGKFSGVPTFMLLILSQKSIHIMAPSRPILILLWQAVQGIKDPITAPNVLPPSNYQFEGNTASTPTDSDKQLSQMSFVKAPNSEDSGAPDVYQVSSSSYKSSQTSSGTSSNTGSSVTVQAVTSGMDLQTCINAVKQTSSQYSAFEDAIGGLSSQVHKSKLRLDAVDILTHNIQVNQDTFESELKRLKDLYNTLAIRANALGKWMADEKSVRDNLQELYREMVSKNTEEEQRLLLMTANMRTAIQRLAKVQDETSGILQSVASAQNAMYDWAANVTVAVNTHTTKLDSLQAAVEYRITQIDNVIPEMRNIAKRAIYISRSLGETNLAYAAANVLSHVESVMGASNTTGTIVSIPTR